MANANQASGSFSLVSPPSEVALVDALGRPAGVLISEPLRLGIFATWGVGTFNFEAQATEFSATVCFPTPEIGVRGILLDDGTLLTGQVFLVGTGGVQLRRERINLDPGEGCSTPQTLEVIRLDVLGDPLFLRAQQVGNLFATPRWLKTLTFVDDKQTVICGPDAYGNVLVTVNNNLAADTALRVHPTARGTQINVVGSVLE